MEPADSLGAGELGAQTARLRLSLIAAADAAELHRVLNDPELHRFTGGVPLSFEELKRRIAAWRRLKSPDGRELWLNWAVRLRAGGHLVGYVQASVDDGVASIAYVIGRAHWGRGLASEATLAMCEILQQRLLVKELVAHIHPLHEASQRVAGRVGLARSGEVDREGEEIWKLRLTGSTAGSG